MPNPSHLATYYGDPENYEPPMSIAVARLKGFTEFYFYPTAKAATDASIERCYADDRIKTTTFDQVIKVSGSIYILHVLGVTARPRIKVMCNNLSHPSVVHIQDHACHNPWTLTDSRKQRFTDKSDGNPKLSAFAVFMGEWAAKIRNAVSR